jgi:hypothetical protein
MAVPAPSGGRLKRATRVLRIGAGDRPSGLGLEPEPSRGAIHQPGATRRGQCHHWNDHVKIQLHYMSQGGIDPNAYCAPSELETSFRSVVPTPGRSSNCICSVSPYLASVAVAERASRQALAPNATIATRKALCRNNLGTGRRQVPDSPIGGDRGGSAWAELRSPPAAVFPPRSRGFPRSGVCPPFTAGRRGAGFVIE